MHLDPKTKAALAAILVFLTTGAFFMANVEMPPWAGYVSALSIVAFAIPSIWALRRWLGRGDAAALFVLLGIYALAIESLAIATGFPYGHFDYADALGYRLFGYSPWTVAFAWTPLILGAYAAAHRIFRNAIVRIAFTAIALTGADMVLDPGAVFLGFWRYAEPGIYYGVPWSNFGGWLISGAAGAVLIELFLAWRRPLLPAPVQLMSSLLLILFFWTAFAVFAGMPLPFLIGAALLAAGVGLFRRYHYRFDQMLVLLTDEGEAIGTMPKADVHHSDTPLHSAFSVFLFDDQGRTLMQQRADSKATWPGVWSNSCCGHVMLHEDVTSAARRRVKYELGAAAMDLEIALPDFRYRAERDGIVENEICPVLIGKLAGPPNPNSDEVGATKWVEWRELVAMAEDPGSGLSPWAVEEVLLLNEQPALISKFVRPDDIL
jgi:isopentenyl-diphosphate Delta-isomerase